MPSNKDYAKCSLQVYEPNGGNPGGPWVVLTDSARLDFGVADKKGYFGAVYWNESTKEIVISHRGTEFSEPEDVESLLQNMRGERQPQFEVAQQFNDEAPTKGVRVI